MWKPLTNKSTPPVGSMVKRLFSTAGFKEGEIYEVIGWKANRGGGHVNLEFEEEASGFAEHFSLEVHEPASVPDEKKFFHGQAVICHDKSCPFPGEEWIVVEYSGITEVKIYREGRHWHVKEGYLSLRVDSKLINTDPIQSCVDAFRKGISERESQEQSLRFDHNATIPVGTMIKRIVESSLLTVGNLYCVVDSEPANVGVIDDKGKRSYFNPDCFKTDDKSQGPIEFEIGSRIKCISRNAMDTITIGKTYGVLYSYNGEVGIMNDLYQAGFYNCDLFVQEAEAISPLTQVTMNLAPELLARRANKFFTDKKYDQLDSIIQTMDDKSLELRTTAERAMETAKQIENIRYDLNVYVTNKDPIGVKKTETRYEEFDQSDFDTVSVKLLKQ